MPKKKEKIIEEVPEYSEEVSEQVIESEVNFNPLTKLDLDFGREDLNKLKDKVNEIIEWLN